MVEAYCLDPKGALSFFHEVHGSVHMSGTLRPLDQYVRVCGLGERTRTANFESPFPKDNRKVLFVEDVETKYESRSDPNAVQKLHDHVSDLANAVPRNTMIFFPSHAMLHNYLYRNERLLTKKVYREVQGESQEKLVADIGRFKRDSRKGAVFFAVMGGGSRKGWTSPSRSCRWWSSSASPIRSHRSARKGCASSTISASAGKGSSTRSTCRRQDG